LSIRPIFIFSAPRSGSTLLQRLLAAHEDVATASEPWVLLPMLTPLRENVPAAGGFSGLVHEALEDFVGQLPGGRADYLGAVRAAALQLYAAAAGRDEGWFVDKSPIYHLVVDEIVEAFPDGRFVFLWRNPLAVVASAVQLFDSGHWEVNRYTMALFHSFNDLVAGQRRHAAVSHAIRFEDIVERQEDRWRELLAYIGLSYDSSVFERFADVRLVGRKGDPVDGAKQPALDPRRAESWPTMLANPVRRAWCHRYLRWLGADRLNEMGYKLDDLQAALDATPRSWQGAADDARRLSASLLRDTVKTIVPPHTGDRSVWSALAGRHWDTPS
jgi:hypothetical protein